MKTSQKLLLDDLIEITLTTYANIWGMKTPFANSEEDLRDMIIWIEDQFRRSSAGQKIRKFGLYSEPNEEIRDLEDDLKRGIK
jgi:hypothetical protein